MNGILRIFKKTENSKFTTELLRSAEQRINFIYFLLMIAFEAAIIIYILLNDWDITRYYFGIRSGVVLLVGIALNIFTMRKNYPWVKYVNNLVIIYTIFVLGAFTDLIAMLFIMIPFINSFYFRPRFTAITGVVCIVMMYFSFMIITATIFNENGDIDYNFFSIIQTSFDFSNENVVLIIQNRSFLMITGIALVVVSVYLSFSSRKFTIQQGELLQKSLSTETELKVAKNIQEGILSSDFPDNDSYAVCASMTTATEVGGDFYDYFLTDETHLALVIGDVSGHGMAAAMFMTLSKTLIKVYAQAHYSTDKVFDLTNRYLQQSNPAKFFVTGWIGILDLTTGVLTYTNAGHNFPVILRDGKEPEFLRSKTNFVLGRRRLIRYKEKRIKLHPGDKLVLYTDGVTDAQTPDGSFFGDDRLLAALNAAKEQNQEGMLSALRREVTAFENGNEHYDDATALVLYYKNYYHTEPPLSKSFFLTEESFDDVTAYIADCCTAAGCDENTVGQITIASSEILANIDMYVYEAGGDIEVLTKCINRRMTVIFKDNGAPFNPLLVQDPDVTLPLSKRKPGGLGIFIVKKLMSDYSYTYENGQNVLKIEMDF